MLCFVARGLLHKVWRDVVAESYACLFDVHPTCSMDESDVSPVILANIHMKRGGDLLVWFDKFCVAKRIQEGGVDGCMLLGLPTC